MNSRHRPTSSRTATSPRSRQPCSSHKTRLPSWTFVVLMLATALFSSPTIPTTMASQEPDDGIFPLECLAAVGSLLPCALQCTDCIPTNLAAAAALFDFDVPDGATCPGVVQNQACALSTCCADCDDQIRTIFECVGTALQREGCGTYECATPGSPAAVAQICANVANILLPFLDL